MTNLLQPMVKQSKLRDIGWMLWDPIGLLDRADFYHQKWNEAQNQAFANEYDTYLIGAASEVRMGRSWIQVVDYLVQVETQHIGLRGRPDARLRAEKVVKAVLADPELWTWLDHQGRFV